ncbi:MAG TPA: YceI family protein [Candidatus Baltobacteraceae bacterium]|nr:YceI family protein [Candidatus Baltobacteraceae bacterium]
MTTVQTQEKLLYGLDTTHSTVEFIVRHLMISKVRGRFTAFQGSIEMPPGSDVPEAVNATIDAASIDTREDQRDAHLRSADFFEAEKFPTLTFQSTRIEGAPDEFFVCGNLTIHGVMREVVLKGSFEGRGSDPWGGERIGFSAHTTINRKDFGLGWNAALETGGVVVSDEVRIELNVEGILQK